QFNKFYPINSHILSTINHINNEKLNQDLHSISVSLEAIAPKLPNTDLFVGLNKGHVVTKKELPPRPANRKGKTSKRVHFERNVIREVAGFTPYEKTITELLKVDEDKRALKAAKRKLSTHEGTKTKCEEMSNASAR
ncbi:hypothetical protein CICLE_v10010663mg, partial [Citrus x clementina]